MTFSYLSSTSAKISEKGGLNGKGSMLSSSHLFLSCNFNKIGKQLIGGGGGAKRIVRFWGGKTYYRAHPPKLVLEASKSGIRLVCACFF